MKVPKTPPKKMVAFRADASLRDELNKLARVYHIQRSVIIRDAISAGLPTIRKQLQARAWEIARAGDAEVESG